MTIKVFDNFTDKNTANKIEDLLISLNFQLYYSSCKAPISHKDKLKDDNLKSKVVDNFQFYHILYEKNKIQSTYLSEVLPSIEKSFLNIDYICRIKCNLNTILYNYNKDSIQIPHKDTNDDWKPFEDCVYSLLYYVNDSDGDTVFYDDNEKEIFRSTPKKGKAVLFKSKILHAACNPITTNKRIVINTIFKAKEELLWI